MATGVFVMDWSDLGPLPLELLVGAIYSRVRETVSNLGYRFHVLSMSSEEYILVAVRKVEVSLN